MLKTNYQERIKQVSLWNTGTPSAIALKMPFYGLESGHFYAESDYKVARNFHDSFLILLTLKGLGTVNGKDLPEGKAYVIDCHDPHSYSAASDDWEFLWLHFKGTAAFDIVGLLPEGDNDPVTVTPEFKELMLAVADSFYLQNTCNLLKTSNGIAEILRIYLECTLQGSEPVSLRKNMDEAISYIHNNFEKQITIDDIASSINLSKYHFIRCFKRITGVTPYAYLTNARITAAKRLLVETGLSVEEIGLSVGFLDTANFISKFRQHTGLSPLKYRNSSVFKI